MANVVAIDAGGNAWFIEPGKPPEVVFAFDSVNPSFRPLLGAAQMLYRVAGNNRDMLESLTTLLEQHGLDAAVPSILSHQAALDFAMRAAREGLEKIVQRKK